VTTEWNSENQRTIGCICARFYNMLLRLVTMTFITRQIRLVGRTSFSRNGIRRTVVDRCRKKKKKKVQEESATSIIAPDFMMKQRREKEAVTAVMD